MTYKITVLKKMIELYNKQLEDIQKAVVRNQHINNSYRFERIADIVAKRSLVASFIANDGVSTVPLNFRRGSVYFDDTLYKACASES